MTGIEFLKAPDTTAGELADIISAPCPPSSTQRVRSALVP